MILLCECSPHESKIQDGLLSGRSLKRIHPDTQKNTPIHPPPNQRFGRGLLGRKVKISIDSHYFCQALKRHSDHHQRKECRQIKKTDAWLRFFKWLMFFKTHNKKIATSPEQQLNRSAFIYFSKILTIFFHGGNFMVVHFHEQVSTTDRCL